MKTQFSLSSRKQREILSKSDIDRWGCLSSNADIQMTDLLLCLVNNPTTLLASGGCASELKVLDLRGETLCLPSKLGQFAALEELYLSHNQLSQIPDEIGSLTKLRILSLGQNNIKELPSTMGELWTSLTAIFLGENNISKMPFHEYDMSHLRQASIGSNPLPEPQGKVCWMLRADAKEMPSRLSYLVSNEWSKSHQAQHAAFFLERALSLASQMNEPMVYESFFEGMSIDSMGKIKWNHIFTGTTPLQTQQLRQLGLSLLFQMTRGSLVDSSLWAQNIHYLDLSEQERLWDHSILELPELNAFKLHPSLAPSGDKWVPKDGVYIPKSKSSS
jgi:Leucine-rich repeat (LRR) protein